MSSRQDNGITAHLTSILCWTFLPSLFTNLLLSSFYRISPSSRPTLPPNASPPQVASANSAAQRHFRRARITLVLSYLAYSILTVYWSQSSGVNQNYYSLLGLSRQVVDSEGSSAVKSQWRRLARIYHPDKVGKGGEQRFVELRKGVEILENENKRWAYERFGPTINEWGKLVSNREFLVKGATNAGAFWVFAFLSIAGISFFRKDERRNNFWRYLLLVLSASLEFHFLLRPSPSPTFSFLFPNRLTYEHIALLRQLFISLSMAISQLTPLLFPVPLPSVSPLVDPEQSREQSLELALRDAEELKPLLSRLAHLTKAAEIEATGLQHLELRPLVLLDEEETAKEQRTELEVKKEMEGSRRKVVEGVKVQMKSTFEDLQLKSHPNTARIWEAAVKNGRDRVETGSEGKKEIEKEAKIENGEKSDPFEQEEEEEEEVQTSTVLEPFESVPSPPTSPRLRTFEIEEVKDETNNTDGHSEVAGSTGSSTHLPSPPPELENKSK
ncbi:uncharacterized protein JCM6883_004306 [Sporobolomyces salmoneus]|uniref:uncharacterized protein n=1 Tax=Sporobolomyces salmoneus TaxID=183962 RepID=UPI003179BA89